MIVPKLQRPIETDLKNENGQIVVSSQMVADYVLLCNNIRIKFSLYTK